MIRSSNNLLRAGLVAGITAAAAHHAQAADVTSFYVRKGLTYEQSSAAAPSPSIFVGEFIARANVDTFAVQGVELTTPSSFFPSFSLDQTGDHFEFITPGSLSDIDSFFPAGNYGFTFNADVSSAPLNFAAGAPPSLVPQVLNFDAAQNIEASQNFTLNFTPFTGAGAGDLIEFEVLANDGSTLFSRIPAGSSVLIPAGTLSEDENYDARLRFVHNVASDSSSVPGATGTAGYFTENQFTLSTGGGGTGGDDTTPPTLLFVSPSNGATGVAVSSTITFAFSEEMAPQQSIQWSANVTPANFSYTWISPQALIAKYNGNLPADATITYTLTGGATGFKDVAGNALSAAGASGSFSTGTGGGGSTGGGGNDPCTSTNNPPSGAGGGFLFKAAYYDQTGNNNPTPDPEDPATVLASYSPATNSPVSAVKVTGPNNLSITLSNLFGTYFVTQPLGSSAQVDAAFPAGAYTITATGAGSGTVDVPALSTIPVPKLNNLVELSTFDPTKDFTLQFSPYTGATGLDGIQITISGQNGDHFYAPDYCLNRLLPNTATSVVIPANTFKPGEKLSGSISFSRFTFNTNAIPNTTLTAAASTSTDFDFTAGNGGGGSDVRWNGSFNLNPDGTITFTAAVPAGKTAKVQSSTDLKVWTDVPGATATGGTLTFTANTKTGGNRTFYRLAVQ